MESCQSKHTKTRNQKLDNNSQRSYLWKAMVALLVKKLISILLPWKNNSSTKCQKWDTNTLISKTLLKTMVFQTTTLLSSSPACSKNKDTKTHFSKLNNRWIRSCSTVSTIQVVWLVLDNKFTCQCKIKCSTLVLPKDSRFILKCRWVNKSTTLPTRAN